MLQAVAIDVSNVQAAPQDEWTIFLPLVLRNFGAVR